MSINEKIKKLRNDYLIKITLTSLIISFVPSCSLFMILLITLFSNTTNITILFIFCLILLFSIIFFFLSSALLLGLFMNLKYNTSVRALIIQEILNNLNMQNIIYLQNFTNSALAHNFPVANIFKPKETPSTILHFGIRHSFNTYFEFVKNNLKIIGTEIVYYISSRSTLRKDIQGGILLKIYPPQNINLPTEFVYNDGQSLYFYFPYKEKWNFSLISEPNYQPLLQEINYIILSI